MSNISEAVKEIRNLREFDEDQRERPWRLVREMIALLREVAAKGDEVLACDNAPAALKEEAATMATEADRCARRLLAVQP